MFILSLKPQQAERVRIIHRIELPTTINADIFQESKVILIEYQPGVISACLIMYKNLDESVFEENGNLIVCGRKYIKFKDSIVIKQNWNRFFDLHYPSLRILSSKVESHIYECILQELIG